MLSFTANKIGLNNPCVTNGRGMMMTLHLNLKMTTTQVVETSVTNNSLSKDYPHSDDHAKPITDIPGFKPFTKQEKSVSFSL